MKKFLILLVLIPAILQAQPIAQKAADLMVAYVKQQKFNGTVLIAQHGQPVFQRAYGFASIDQKAPNTLQTEFRAGSLSKMFTATAILKLVDRAKLSLQDHLSDYIPGFQEGNKITIENLLSHTSGIVSFTALPGYAEWSAKPSTLQQTIDRFRALPLNFQPGEKFEYSNSNYILLTAIAEKIYKKPLARILQEEVFQPAGMLHSGLDSNQRVSSNRATGYMLSPAGDLEPAQPIDISIAAGAGAVYTTAENLLLWSKSIASGKILSSQMAARAFQPVKDDYGLGWMCKTGAHQGIGHTGSVNGFMAYFMYYPKDDLAVIFLSNTGSFNGRQLASDLTAVAYNEPYTMPQAPEAAALPEAVLQSYAGVYELKDQLTVEVLVENGHIYAWPKGDNDKTELIPNGTDKFYVAGPQVPVEFIREEGKPKYLLVHMQGEMKLEKIK